MKKAKTTNKTMKLCKAITILIGIITLFIFCAPLVAAIFNFGNMLGMIISLITIIIGARLEKLVELVKKLLASKKGKAIFAAAVTIIASLGLCFCITLGSVIAFSTTNAGNEKTVIVLGCAVRGYAPSVTLNARVNAAYRYLSANEDAVAILSGGQGNGEKISEAECMFELLTSKGIDESRLYIEDKSTNTDENIAFSKAVIEENRLDTNIAIATSDYHLKRATMIANKNGFDAKRISAKSGFFDVPTFYLRDTIAVIKEFLLG